MLLFSILGPWRRRQDILYEVTGATVKVDLFLPTLPTPPRRITPPSSINKMNVSYSVVGVVDSGDGETTTLLLVISNENRQRILHGGGKRTGGEYRRRYCCPPPVEKGPSGWQPSPL